MTKYDYIIQITFFVLVCNQNRKGEKPGLKPRARASGYLRPGPRPAQALQKAGLGWAQLGPGWARLRALSPAFSITKRMTDDEMTAGDDGR